MAKGQPAAAVDGAQEPRGAHAAEPATEKQYARLDRMGIAHPAVMTMGEAWHLIKDNMPGRGNRVATVPGPRRRTRTGKKVEMNPYLTKKALETAKAGIIADAAAGLAELFKADAEKFYAAVKRLRDKPDPDTRIVIYGIDRIMGKTPDKTEVEADVTVNIISKIPRPNADA